MFRFQSPGCERQILFFAALNFSPDSTHSTAKFALIKTKFARIRLGTEI
jgi:hypothetical protein